MTHNTPTRGEVLHSMLTCDAGGGGHLYVLDDWFEGVATNAVEPEGIIVLKKHGGGGGGGTGVKDTKDGREASHEDGDDGFMIYDEFSPLSLMQHHQPVCGGEGGDGGVGPQTTTRVKRVEGGFDAALDDYFATAEEGAFTPLAVTQSSFTVQGSGPGCSVRG